MTTYLRWVSDIYEKTVLSKVKRSLSKKIRFIRIKQIHVEEYFYDDVWGLIKSFRSPSRVTWYVMTPVNYDYFKILFPVKKNELNSKMSRRIRWMSEHNYPLGLHIHFYQRGSMPISKKRKMLEESLSWGSTNQVLFKKFVPGWFNYTEDLESLCDEFNLELTREEPYIHDEELKNYIQFFEKQKLINTE